MKSFKAVASAIVAVGIALGVSACSSDADVASENLSKDADNFKIMRRVVFYNGITDKYILEIEGLCSVTPGSTLTVTCKTGPNAYKKHFLSQSDNVTWFAEQLENADVSTSHYKVIFKPSEIIPSIEAR